MYENLMIPLDGSKLAECVLPHVEAFVKNGLVKNASFVRVLEPLPVTLYDASVTFDMVPSAEAPPSGGRKEKFFPDMEYWERQAAERNISAKAYLDNVSNRFNQYRTTIKCEVLEGPVAETLASYSEENNIDLILIATHGRSGVGRWLMGSVADRVLRSSSVPVLMVNAAECAGAD